jgi:hypothetical protein
MKPTDQTLQTLLAAAAKAPQEPAVAAPLGLETRVLANWRARATEDESSSLFAFFRHAVLGASLVLVLSAAWTFAHRTAGTTGDEATLLNYAIQVSLNP